MVGANDFAIWNGTFQQVYDGTISGAALTAKIDGIVASIRVALDTVSAAGAVQLFVATLGDRTTAPPFPATFPDPAKRQIVSNAIVAVNSGIRAVATQRGIPVIDLDGMANAILPQIDANGNLFVSGEAISFSIGGDEPHHVLLGDYEHIGTVFGGVLANYFIAQVGATGWGIGPFTDEELLHNAGIFPVVPDTTVPAVSITNPANDAVVSGSITVSASASDNEGILGVRFKVDGIILGIEDTTAPYSRSWNATNVAPGAHVLTAEARDAANNVATASATVTVLDKTPPTVTVTAPPNGGQVTGALTVRASASDNIGVAGVTFYWGSTALGPEDTQAPYNVTVQTTYAHNGTVSLSAVARDTSGNTRTSSPVMTTINNPVPDTTPPLVSITGPLGTVSKTVTISATATDNVNVVGVQFRLNGSNLGAEDTSAPYSSGVEHDLVPEWSPRRQRDSARRSWQRNDVDGHGKRVERSTRNPLSVRLHHHRGLLSIRQPAKPSGRRQQLPRDQERHLGDPAYIPDESGIQHHRPTGLPSRHTARPRVYHVQHHSAYLCVQRRDSFLERAQCVNHWHERHDQNPGDFSECSELRESLRQCQSDGPEHQGVGDAFDQD